MRNRTNVTCSLRPVRNPAHNTNCVPVPSHESLETLLMQTLVLLLLVIMMARLNQTYSFTGIVKVFFLVYSAIFLTSQCDALRLDKRNSTGLTDAVTWDPHSLSIFGQRIFILSAEFHPWRQPNPYLWKDIFQKVKDNGFNTVSFYINWALHYPSAIGEPDFQPGTYRDIQMFIDEAKEAGLWLIAR